MQIGQLKVGSFGGEGSFVTPSFCQQDIKISFEPHRDTHSITNHIIQFQQRLQTFVQKVTWEFIK